jgi:hypothetical protein
MLKWVPEKSCTAQEARTQCYQDFAEGIDVYEKLEKIVDARRLLIILLSSVEFRFLTNVQRIKGSNICLMEML